MENEEATRMKPYHLMLIDTEIKSLGPGDGDGGN
jgi:hypothetical protein